MLHTKATTCVSTTTVHDLLFADDCALNTVTEEDMQRSMDLFAEGCAGFGLTISTAKTNVMHQPPPSAEYNAYFGLTISTAKTVFAQDRPAWRRSVKTASAIYKTNQITAAKAKRASRKSPAPRTNIFDAQTLPTCPRCQRIFFARIGLFGHLQTQCTKNPTIPTSTSNSDNPLSDSPTLTPGINSITPTIIETTSIYSSPVTPTTATTTAFAFTTTTTISDGESLLSCTQCDRKFTSRIGLVGHLRIHRTETGEPVPGAPSHSRDRRLHCPHCPHCSRAFTHRMGLFSQMRIHDILSQISSS
ncbi:unnamed protein product [Schistocephalus solidus]|uniref:C2H2-type domain-containing protein n=1 Tax=Schistocephalus solidus TaxID=70667 RepID=A0A183TBR0_SCHSO|nr:unnamed protein product [Schistocephalus solidus]